MRTFILYKKELLAYWRSSKFLWLPISFAILALLQPLTLYYMPQILEWSGGLPDGITIEMMDTDLLGGEVLASVYSQFNMVGIVIIVASGMGMINNERQNGTMSLVLSRPVANWEYIVSKWLSELSLMLISLLASISLATYYTMVLFADLSLLRMLESILIYLAFVAFVIALTLLFSSILKNNGAIMAAGVGVLALLVLLEGMMEKFFLWSPTRLTKEVSFLLNDGALSEHFLISIIATIILTLVCLVLATLALKRQEHA